MNKLTISPSPHIHSGDTVEKKMYGVIIALLPALAVSLYVFGLGAFIVSASAIISCILIEWFIQKVIIKGPTSVTDGSALLTGLLLGLNLPSNLPIWMIFVGSVVAIGIAKMSFGGLGNNIFNPALAGRVFLLISFPAQMTTWPSPSHSWTSYLNAATSATPLSQANEHLINFSNGTLKSGGELAYNYINMFFGQMGGSLGEVSVLALLIGFAFLLFRKIITWHIPISIFLSIALLGGFLHYLDPVQCPPALFHLMAGGVVLGAVFMATDYVSSPMTSKGMIIYGVGIGVLTVVIRQYGSYPEGISFAILLMNAFTPLINRYVKPKRFGEAVKK